MAELGCLQLILVTHILSTIYEMRNWCRHSLSFGLLSLIYWKAELPRITNTEYSLTSLSLRIFGAVETKDTNELVTSVFLANVKLGSFLVLESIFFDQSQLFSAIVMVRMLAVIIWWEMIRDLKFMMADEGAFDDLRQAHEQSKSYSSGSIWIYFAFHFSNVLPDVLRFRFLLLFVIMTLKICEKMLNIFGILWHRLTES